MLVIGYIVDWIDPVARMHIGELTDSLADWRRLTIALPVLDAVVTPQFVARASGEQAVALIRLLAGHSGFNVGLSAALVEKIIYFADIIKARWVSDDSIKKLIYELISDGKCAVLKHLLGRHCFCHKFSVEEACEILEEYSSKCMCSDESFVPLIAYLVLGYASEIPCADYISGIGSMLLDRNPGAAKTPLYARIWYIQENSRHGNVSISDAIDSYACASDDRSFNASEDLLCAIISDERNRDAFADMQEQIRGTRAAHAARHILRNWIQHNTLFCANTMREAIAQRNFAVVDVVLPIFMNTKQTGKTMDDIFGEMKENSCLDYVAMMEYSTNDGKFKYLKRNSLMKLLKEEEAPWSILYLAGKTNVRNRACNDQNIRENCEHTMNKIVAGRHNFSPLFHEVLRYDTANLFIARNILVYFRELLGVHTSRHTIERLLREVCSPEIVKNKMDVTKMADIYKLFETHPDSILYLDTFYHALSHRAHRNGLKIIIIRKLEAKKTAKNRWVVESMKNGVLYRRRKCKHCDGYRCTKEECDYCELISGIAFKDLVAALRYAEVPAPAHERAEALAQIGELVQAREQAKTKWLILERKRYRSRNNRRRNGNDTRDRKGRRGKKYKTGE